jgi:hypothetical protein
MKHRRIAPSKDQALVETRALARAHAPAAMEELARLARAASSESVQLAAIKEILDRAYGRPESGAGEGGSGPNHLLVDDGYPG